MSERTKILVAEDDDKQKQYLEWLLVASGFDVTQVINGIEALASLEQHGPNYFNLIVTDLRMPKMSGLAWINKALETIESFTGPVIFHSTSTQATYWKNADMMLQASDLVYIATSKKNVTFDKRIFFGEWVVKMLV